MPRSDITLLSVSGTPYVDTVTHSDTIKHDLKRSETLSYISGASVFSAHRSAPWKPLLEVVLHTREALCVLLFFSIGVYYAGTSLQICIIRKGV